MKKLFLAATVLFVTLDASADMVELLSKDGLQKQTLERWIDNTLKVRNVSILNYGIPIDAYNPLLKMVDPKGVNVIRSLHFEATGFNQRVLDFKCKVSLNRLIKKLVVHSCVGPASLHEFTPDREFFFEISPALNKKIEDARAAEEARNDNPYADSNIDNSRSSR